MCAASCEVIPCTAAGSGAEIWNRVPRSVMMWVEQNAQSVDARFRCAALVIAFFYAFGTAMGGLAALVEALVGISAERRPPEDIAPPLGLSE